MSGLLIRKEVGVLCVWRQKLPTQTSGVGASAAQALPAESGLLCMFRKGSPGGRAAELRAPHQGVSHGFAEEGLPGLSGRGDQRRQRQNPDLRRQRQAAIWLPPLLLPLALPWVPRLPLAYSTLVLLASLTSLLLWIFLLTFLTNKQRSDQPRVEVLYQVFIGVVDVREARGVLVRGPAVLGDDPLVGVLVAGGYCAVHPLCRECVVGVRSPWKSGGHSASGSSRGPPHHPQARGGTVSTETRMPFHGELSSPGKTPWSMSL